MNKILELVLEPLFMLNDAHMINCVLLNAILINF